MLARARGVQALSAADRRAPERPSSAFAREVQVPPSRRQRRPRWPHRADAWYEPGAAPEKMGKPPKQRKTPKRVLAARPMGGGPHPDGDRRAMLYADVIKAMEEKMAHVGAATQGGLRWSIKGAGRGGQTIVSR